MINEQEDSRPLVDEDHCVTLPHGTIKQPRCKFYIETVLFFSSLFGMPRLVLDPLLLYYFIAEDIRGNRTNLNISELQTSNACHVNTSDPMYQYREEIQENAAIYYIYQSLASSIPAFFIAIFLGAYSDKVGRKYALIPPVVGDTLSLLLTMFIIIFRFPTWVLIVSSFLMGCGGNYQTFLLGCFAYIADITEPKDRAFRIIVVEMLMFGCGIFGFIGIGYWVEAVGFLWPYVTLFGGKLFVTLAIVFLVPETVIKDKNASFFSLQHLIATSTMIKSKLYPGRRWKLLLLLLAFFLPTIVILGEHIDSLFEMNVPMCWNPEQLSRYSAIYIAAISVGGVVGAKVLKILSVSDVGIAMIAGISAVLMDIYKAFVMSSLMMYFVPAIGFLTGLFIPTLRAIMSNLVQAHEQGSLFGAIACVEVACSLVGSVMFSAIYASTVGFMRGFVYLVNSIFYGSGVILLVVYILRCKRSTQRRLSVDCL